MDIRRCARFLIATLVCGWTASASLGQCDAAARVTEYSYIPTVANTVATSLYSSAVGVWDPDGIGPRPECLLTVDGSNTIWAWDGTHSVAITSTPAGFAGSLLASPYNGRLIHIGSTSAWEWNGVTWSTLGNSPLPLLPKQAVVWQGKIVAAGHWNTQLQTNVVYFDGAAWLPMPPLSDVAYSLCVYNGQLLAALETSVYAWTGTAWQKLFAKPAGHAYGLVGYQGELWLANGGTTGDTVYRRRANAWEAVPTPNLGTFFRDLVVWNNDLYLLHPTYAPAPGALGSNSPAFVRWTGAGWKLPDTGFFNTPSALGSYQNKLVVCGNLIRETGYFSVGLFDGGHLTVLPTGAIGQFQAHHPLQLADELVVDVGSRAAAWNGAAWRWLGNPLPAPIEQLAVAGQDLIASTGEIPNDPARTTTILWRLRPGAPQFERLAVFRTAPWTGFPPYAGIRTIAALDGQPVVAGDFVSIDGVGLPFRNCAAYNGTTWHSLGRVETPIAALANHDGGLYAARSLPTITRVEQWNPEARSWTRIGPDAPPYTRALLFVGDHPALSGYFWQAATSRYRSALVLIGGSWQEAGSSTRYEYDGFATVGNTLWTSHGTEGTWSHTTLRASTFDVDADIASPNGLGPDGRRDALDVVAFESWFNANDARADIGAQGGVPHSDGVLDQNDWIVFIQLLYQQCP